MSKSNDVTLAEKGIIRTGSPVQNGRVIVKRVTIKPLVPIKGTQPPDPPPRNVNSILNKGHPGKTGSTTGLRSPNVLTENDFSFIDDEDSCHDNSRPELQLQQQKLLQRQSSRDDHQPIDPNNDESQQLSTSSNKKTITETTKTINDHISEDGDVKLTCNKIIINNNEIEKRSASVTSDRPKPKTSDSSPNPRHKTTVDKDSKNLTDRSTARSISKSVSASSARVASSTKAEVPGLLASRSVEDQIQNQSPADHSINPCVSDCTDPQCSCCRRRLDRRLNETVQTVDNVATRLTIGGNECGTPAWRCKRCTNCIVAQNPTTAPVTTNAINRTTKNEKLKQHQETSREPSSRTDNVEKCIAANMFAGISKPMAVATNPIGTTTSTNAISETNATPAATQPSSTSIGSVANPVSPESSNGITSTTTNSSRNYSQFNNSRCHSNNNNNKNNSSDSSTTANQVAIATTTTAGKSKSAVVATISAPSKVIVSGDLDHDSEKSRKMCSESSTKLCSDESCHHRRRDTSDVKVNTGEINKASKIGKIKEIVDKINDNGGDLCAGNLPNLFNGNSGMYRAALSSDKIATTNRANGDKSARDNCDLGQNIGLGGNISDEDPYSELEHYLEKVKREINEVFEQYKTGNDELPRSMIADSNTSNNKLLEQKTACSLNDTNSDKKLNKISSSNSNSDSNSREAKRRAFLESSTALNGVSATVNVPGSGTVTDCNQDEYNFADREPSRVSGADLNGEQHNRPAHKSSMKTQSPSSSPTHDSNDVNIWANTILRELDNLMGSDKRSSVKSVKDHVVSANNEKNRSRSNILKPEKHLTIPLYSFNLDQHPLLDSSGAFNSKKPPIDLNRKTPTSASSCGSPQSTNPSNCNSRGQVVNSNGGMKESSQDTMTVLKIEEDTEGGNSGRGGDSDATTTVAARKSPLSPATPAFAKKENAVMLNDGIKKGSTSTIWTSEESILRSVGAVDEDNKSTSSSACDEATGVLSSGKSGNSLDSSELDNDNNESGIGTATPPKDSDSWKNIRPICPASRQNSVGVSNSHPFHRIRCYKSNSIPSSDDPDLLEVLSQCDGTNDDEDLLNHEYDYFDCVDSKSTENDDDDVILRNRPRFESERSSHHNNLRLGNGSVSLNRIKKGRSHSIETSHFTAPRNDFELFEKANDSDFKTKRPFCLPLNQELFQCNTTSNIRELPSPSSASLHSGHGNLVLQELTTKSNSAPILLKKEKRKDDFGGQQNSLRYSRSQSDRYLAEIEAIEACKWLRAAGFPQYAQMYEDLQFPIDLSNVAKDNPILEADPLQSLYRRLCILNRCATMRLDSTHKQHGQQQKDDSDDEGFALSENWTFQPQSRRWSRVGEMGLELPTKADKGDISSKDSSPDRFDDDDDNSATLFPLNLDTSPSDPEAMAVRFRRTGSERLKDGAKAFLRRVESIKSRRRKRQNREGLVISGPQVLDLSQMNQKVTDLKCIDVTTLSNPPSPLPTSPLYSRTSFLGSELKVPQDHHTSDKFLSPNRLSPKHIPTTPRSAQSMRTSPLHFFATQMPHLREGKSDDSSSYCSDSPESSSGGRLVVMRRQPSRSRRFLQRTGKVDDIGTLSDSECHQAAGRKMILKDANSNNTEIKVKKLSRGGSLNLGKDSKRYRDAFQSRSFRSRTSVRKNQKASESDKEDVKISKSPVVRWHSFQNHDRPQLIFKKCFSGKVEPLVEGTAFDAMSCGQLQVIRKLALVTLTGYMERYCPSHRSGWNWELPKFIKKIKTPDYRDKKVFGIPFLLVLQRSGHSLPKAIRSAFKWMQANAMDQIGLFRKSGVKSRITKLKEMIETSDTDCLDIYDTHQAYDVADMLKQYFRDLPESLLTTKMSETFVAIFQHLPPEVRGDAVQSAVLLLPDEHREVLHALLEFLNQVAENSQYNQMTANNLAVCLAPSLFNSTIATGRASSVSPRRKKATGVPDAKELSETRASHDCLTFMISNFRAIFTATREKMLRCNFGYMEESKPVPLEALGEGMQFHNWRGYLYECTSATIKEGREKSRGWVTSSSLDPNVEIAYKKVGDGHPLRLWRCYIDVEAPPAEVLNYILKERNLWDATLIKSRIIQKLDERNEIFQYACDGHTITDYCVLRSWQPDLPRGACVIVETSVDHPDASPLLGGVRGVVLASRYLIEPCGSGRSRIMHLARVDTKGRTPEWYNKSYGHICSHYLLKIRSAFRHVADGPESKV